MGWSQFRCECHNPRQVNLMAALAQQNGAAFFCLNRDPLIRYPFHHTDLDTGVPCSYASCLPR